MTRNKKRFQDLRVGATVLVFEAFLFIIRQGEIRQLDSSKYYF